MMKRCLSLLLILILLLFYVPVHAAEKADTSARAAALYCVNNGALLYDENADLRLPIASTTKIMTALITLEYAALDNRTVTFTEEMQAEGSSMYLKPGEQVTLYDLAVGMMMQSGNDAANAAAITIAGSIEGFAVLMNRKADRLGMRDTHFVTPSGLDDDAHYSTAGDMAQLMAAAMENDDFRKITAQTSMTVDFITPSDKRVTYPNHNRLLSLYDGCIGGKTGYTDRAGRCLVTCAEREGLRLIAVTLCDRDDWNDHTALYEYGFSYYALAPLPHLPDRISVVGGEEDSADISLSDYVVVVERDSLDDVRCEVCLPCFLYAPVKKGRCVGTVTCYLSDRKIAQFSVICQNDIAYDSRRRGFLQYIKDLLNWQSW